MSGSHRARDRSWVDSVTPSDFVPAFAAALAVFGLSGIVSFFSDSWALVFFVVGASLGVVLSLVFMGLTLYNFNRNLALVRKRGRSRD